MYRTTILYCFQFLSVVCLPRLAFGQPYPESAKMTVTFYDHCSKEPGQSGDWNFNPAFLEYGRIQETVKSKLGSNGKPELNKQTSTNSELNSWYMPNPNASTCKQRVIEVKDVLEFTHTGNGVYRFDNPLFFPLDGKGLNAPGGPEGRLSGHDGAFHNFGFTMELSGTFVYKESEMKNKVLNFASDDDLFIYVNKELVVDIGGIHHAEYNRTSLPFYSVVEKLNLKDGQECTIHIFYAERHQTEASLTLEIPFLKTLPQSFKTFSYQLLKVK